jgi:hypothetical protein
MTDSTSTNKYATRIQALLDKAESTNSEAEAQALTAKAAELMTKYSIEQAEIDAIRQALGEAKGEIICKSMWFAGVHSLGLLTGAYQIVLAFGGNLKGTRSPGTHHDYRGISDGDTRQGTYLNIFGYKSDIEQAELLITSVMLQAISAMKVWWKQSRDVFRWRTDSEKSLLRRSYIEGYFAGAAREIRNARQVVVSESSESAALALRSRADELNEWAAENVSAGSARAHATAHAGYSRGVSDGQRADIGRSRVANRAALI